MANLTVIAKGFKNYSTDSDKINFSYGAILLYENF